MSDHQDFSPTHCVNMLQDFKSLLAQVTVVRIFKKSLLPFNDKTPNDETHGMAACQFRLCLLQEGLSKFVFVFLEPVLFSWHLGPIVGSKTTLCWQQGA